jgi:hypothetical protein
MQKVIGETKMSLQTCRENIANNPQYAPISAKTVLGSDAGDMPLEMLTDKTTASKSEIGLIYKAHKEIQDCRKIALEGLAKVHPIAVGPAIEAFDEQDKLLVELIGDKITWGTYNQQSKTLAAQTKLKLSQAGQQIDAQLQNQHQAEIAQRQQAAAAIQQWSYQQQVLANQRAAINAVNRPVITNCNYVGTTASCTSN